MRSPIILTATLVLLASCTAWATADENLQALSGEWLYVEDRTKGRATEDQQPPMSTTFALRVEQDAVVMVRGQGAKRREMRLMLDGSTTESSRGSSISRYTSEWKENALHFKTEVVVAANNNPIATFQTVLRPTDAGLLVRVEDGIAMYQHREDIALPEPAKATISDVAWIAGSWEGTRGKSAIEERWSPPKGGALLGISRTVAREKMVGFEYLRIVERDGGLIYVAQPGGNPKTEFVLTELRDKRAVFVNPRHDYPQRIIYEINADGGLTTAIGFAKGGKPRPFVYQRAGN